ncbi:MOSC domain-containing protein [Streptomyces buecherae]|uniref:MOSC domain-containing protein n=2 Tax=Streptomyces buecherae TaxID=2763006 RepID=UPI001C25B8BF|nr:MOSC N-terminal beta barrel domain-containing protein [Streptomyces buecherae]
MLGTVRTLRRYPVKSMLGEELAEADVTWRGLRHDRRIALVHRETGKIASAKNPRLWRDLLTLSATVGDAGEAGATGAGEPPVRIALPDGRTLLATDEKADAILSALLGAPVRVAHTPPPGATLERSKPEEVLAAGIDAEVGHDETEIGTGAPDGTFFDFAPLHLITSATLAHIAELSPRGTVEVERYRPNIIVSVPTEPPTPGAPTPSPAFPENAWVGRHLHIGDELMLHILSTTPRCAIPTLAHGPLPRDTHALRVPATHNRVEPHPGMGPQPCAGVYARVVRPGPVRQGDPVRLGETAPTDGELN